MIRDGMSHIFSSISAAVDAEIIDERREHVAVAERRLRWRGRIAEDGSAAANRFTIDDFGHGVRCISNALTSCDG